MGSGCGSDPPANPQSNGGGQSGSAAGGAGAGGTLAGSSSAGSLSASGGGAGGVLALAGSGGGGGVAGTSGAGNGGAAGASGSPAAAGSGGAAAGGAGNCAGLLCEDFESGQIDDAKWDTKTMGGTVALQSARAAHGKYAVQFHGQAQADVQSDYAFLIAHNGPAALAKHHFGRAYFYITPKPMSGHTGMVFAGTPGFPKPAYLEVANINSGWQLGFVKLNGPPNGEEVAYPPGQVPVEKWTCLEWEFNDQPDSATLWIDGNQLGQLNDQTIGYPPGHVPGSPIFNGKSSDLVGGFSDFGFGIYDWHPKNAFDLFYDDIVLDVKRVGCLPQ
jgi:hypothetical protein